MGRLGDHFTLSAGVQTFVLSSTQSVTLTPSRQGNCQFNPAVTSLFVGHFAEGAGKHYVSLVPPPHHH